MKKEFILKEFEYLQYKDNTKDNFIKKETFDSLEKFVLENEKTAQYLKITTKNGFGKVLQAQNYVGVIQTKDGTTIEILPKIKNATTEKSKDIFAQTFVLICTFIHAIPLLFFKINFQNGEFRNE